MYGPKTSEQEWIHNKCLYYNHGFKNNNIHLNIILNSCIHNSSTFKIKVKIFKIELWTKCIQWFNLALAIFQIKLMFSSYYMIKVLNYSKVFVNANQKD